MRRVSLFLAALFCVALLAQQSASADETRLKPTDKSKEWTGGSVWEGIANHRYSNGTEGANPITFEIAKRDGKSFKGRSISGDGTVIMEFDGEVRATGTINITITKVVAAPEEWKKTIGRNVVGTKMSGKVDGKSVTLRAIKPDSGHPKRALTHTYKLKLKD